MSRQADSLESENYILQPLYLAIVVIQDHVASEPPNDDLDLEGFYSIRKLAQLQDVLIVRTGMEERLSAPISFASIASQALPLQRADVATQGINVIRVPLDVAIQFIPDLDPEYMPSATGRLFDFTFRAN
jgi:hypothetical protein